MRVSRGEGDRLTGTIRNTAGSDVREFSGMLELMRVFEDLVPTDRASSQPNAAGGAMNSRGVFGEERD